jgi:hypothetical protein
MSTIGTDREGAGKERKCSTVFEPKCGNSARMVGIDWLTQSESAQEASCCMLTL